MTSNVVTITPDIARTMLEKNSINRPLKRMTVSKYTRQMMKGLWMENTGEAIKFASDGSLLDGQHRLNAVVNANVTLNFLVIKGLDKEIFKVLDTGTKRTASDALHVAGLSNATKLSAGIKKYYLFKINEIHHSKTPTNEEIINIYNKNPQFWDDVVRMASDWYRKERLIVESELIGFYAYFYDIDPDQAFNFMEKIGTGENIDSDSPIKLLRHKLILAKSARRMKLTALMRTALIIKTWNYIRRNTTVKYLVFDPSKEDLPIAQ